MTPDEFNHKIDGLVEEAVLEHKLDMCGNLMYGTSPMTGARMSIRMDCHDYRICLHCNTLYLSMYYTRLLQEKPRYTIVKEEDWKAMRKKLGRNGITYLQWPQDGTRFVLLSEGLTGDEEELPRDFFSPMSEEEWAGDTPPVSPYDHPRLSHILRHVPRGQRPGGKLGKKAPVVEEEGQAIKVEVVMHDKTHSELDKEAWDAAVERTGHLDPKDAVGVETACDERTTAYKEELKARGAAILSTMRVTRYVRSVASISWSVTATKRTPLSRYSFVTGQVRAPVRLERVGLGF